MSAYSACRRSPAGTKPDEFALAASAARSAAGKALDFAARAMIDVHGGIGATWEHDAPLFFRRAQLSRRLLAGTHDATDGWPFDGAVHDTGGSAITSYTVTPYIGSNAQTPSTVTRSPPATNTTINGLTDGTTYRFTVSATNAVGNGPTSSPSGPVTPSASTGGQWSSLMSWPMVAIHSILLDNGKVLQLDGWQPEPTQVWDPITQMFATQTAPDSIFCSGMAQLPDGRVLVVGGYGGLSTGNLGIVDTNIFDPTTNTWTRVANMHFPRWYPDLTELADGRYVAISGNSTNASTWADTPEVFDSTTGQWTVLSGVSTSQARLTRRSTPSRTLLRTETCSRSAHPRISRSFSTSEPRHGRKRVGRAASTTARR